MNRKQLAHSIHSLADPGEKFGKIKFIGFDGKEHTFVSCVNQLSSNRLSYFDNDPPRIEERGNLSYVKTIFKNIRKKSKVLESIGDF